VNTTAKKSGHGKRATGHVIVNMTRIEANEIRKGLNSIWDPLDPRLTPEQRLLLDLLRRQLDGGVLGAEEIERAARERSRAESSGGAP